MPRGLEQDEQEHRSSLEKEEVQELAQLGMSS